MTDGLRRDLSCSTVGPDASVQTPTIVDERDETWLGKTGGSEASRDPNTASDGVVAFRTRSHGPPGRTVDGPQDSALDRMALVSGCREPDEWSTETARTVRDGPRLVRDGPSVRDGPPALNNVAFVGSTQWSTGTAGSVRDGPSGRSGTDLQRRHWKARRCHMPVASLTSGQQGSLGRSETDRRSGTDRTCQRLTSRQRFQLVRSLISGHQVLLERSAADRHHGLWMLKWATHDCRWVFQACRQRMILGRQQGAVRE